MITRFRSPAFPFIAVNLLLTTAAGIYLAATVLHGAPLTRGIFLAMLATGAALNIALTVLFWRATPASQIRSRIMLVLWGWFMFWYWAFSPPYFLLVMNVDRLQLQWVTVAFVWEVLSLGAMYLLLCDRMFRPLREYMRRADKDAVTQEEAEDLYHRAIRFPVRAAVLICIISAVGFAGGELQVRLFAGLPHIEGVKNYLIGFVASLFLAVIYYVTLRGILDPLASELQRRAGIERSATSSISRRVIITSVLVVLSSLLLLQLIVIKSFQNIVHDSIATTLEEDIERNAWNDSVASHSLILVDPQPGELARQKLAPETLAAIQGGGDGVVDDFRDHMKIIGFFTHEVTGVRSVIIVPLDEYYGPLVRTILSFLIGALFVFLAGLGIIAIAMRALTGSIRILTDAIRRLGKDRQTEVPMLATGDEIEELSQALAYFVRRSQTLDREKDEFISIASHHLRTPVTQLHWLIEALERGDVEKNVHTFLPEIKDSVGHIAELAKLLLDTQRFESGELKGAPEAFDLAAHVRGLAGEFEAAAERKKVAFALAAPARIDAYLDKAFLTIILESLLSNAIEYTPEGGRVDVALSEEAGTVSLTCADTGIGIAPKDQEHIFERFVRAGNARAIRPNGTGLGLYVAHHAAERLGGEIRFESEVGKGTTFFVSFPARQEA